ncbi:hypothetical protein [Algoriphagus alkaliphilus]|uniref:hypothetical protein n=1 Tax=Algoriphagus alkaliphilus TaxID=279824 RepID=UPI000B886410|nr:hypothetical protein [Algoriphagus alkaliphilus]MBA4300985.1 hypothetical protein [Cyclobacterium sp.]
MDQLDEIRKKITVESYQISLEPMSMKELENSMSEAEIDFKTGKFISQNELMKRIKGGRIL